MVDPSAVYEQAMACLSPRSLRPGARRFECSPRQNRTDSRLLPVHSDHR